MRIKSIISSSIGNILEWYDFGLFAIYSTLFSHLFFPESDAHAALVSTFGIFALGFLCRPLGALLFGYLGDRWGRAKTLRLSILMISLPTLLIGCVPTYATIGVWASMLLMLIRVWQGISLGGEFSGNIIYLAEIAPKKHRALVTSLAGTGANLGILLAAGMSALSHLCLDDQQFASWGWRVPYLLSGVLSLFIYATRVQMLETPVFQYLKSKKLLVNNPIHIVLRKNISHMLRTIGLVCMGSTFYYLCFLYMPTFLVNELNVSVSHSTQLMTFFIATMLIGVPMAGWLCDRLGRRKMFLMNVGCVLLVSVLGFYFLQYKNMKMIVFILMLFTLVSSLEQGTTSVVVVENFPVPARYTGLSFSYNIGMALFGGTAPLLCEWLISFTHSVLAPAIYVCMCALISGVVAYFFLPETRFKNLTAPY